MKNKIVSLALLLLVIVLAACGSGGAGASGEVANGDGDEVFLDFVSSTPGGAWYAPATAMVQLIEQVDGVSARVSPGGGEANVFELGKGNVHLAYTQTANSAAGYAGDEPYDSAFENLRHLFTTTPVGLHMIVRQDSDIEKIEDLQDKNIGFSPQGYMSNTIAERVFETYGFTLEDIQSNGGTIHYLGLTEGPQSLVDGNIDVFIGQGLWPYTPILEVDNNPGIRFLSIDEEIYDQFLEEYPMYSKFTIESDAYESLDEDVNTVGTYASVITSSEVPEDVIYNIVKTIWENVEEVHDASPQDAEWMLLENVNNGNSIPLHPGAKKYYEEQGIDIE